MTSIMRFDKWQNSLGQSYAAPIQVISKTYGEATSTTTNQSYIAVTNGNLEITTKLDNSKLLVMISMQGYVDATGGVNIGLSRTIGATTSRLLGVDGGNGDSWMGSNHNANHATTWSLTRQYLDSPGVPAGTVITYNSLLGKYSGSAIVAVNWEGTVYNGKSTITIMEIAQ